MPRPISYAVFCLKKKNLGSLEPLQSFRGCLESGDSVWAPTVETPRGASPGRRGRSQVPRRARGASERARARSPPQRRPTGRLYSGGTPFETPSQRSEEHTSELQSLRHLVCRLL